MLDFSNFPSDTKADVQIFYANSPTTGLRWTTWNKPRGKSMVYMFLLGGGGSGGNGAKGAVSAAAGGSGGAAAAQTTLLIPAIMIPDTLFVSCGNGGMINGNNGVDSMVCIYPENIPRSCLAYANLGGGGNDGVGATPGAVAPAPSASTVSQCCLSGLGKATFTGGQASLIATASNTSPVSITLPTTGLMASAGGSGAGLGAAASAGAAGGSITGAGIIPTMLGGAGGSAATVPAENGSTGIRGNLSKLFISTGGSGGGSSNGSATGLGLVGGNGGKGGFGSGGGGGGGALTSSSGGLAGLGGDGIVIIVSW